jgi:hypothetical protein
LQADYLGLPERKNLNMKTGKIFIGLFVTLVILSVSINLLADIDGRTNRTRKTSTSGCGSCHGASGTAGVSVTITGPDTVVAGQTAQYSLVINRAGKTGAGLDVATRRGSLGAVTSGTRLQSGEITHNDNLLMSNGAVTVLFSYTAPASIGLDTIWAVGVATNTSGSSSGDEWNWSANRSLYVKLPTGINQSSSVLTDYNLSQNFPNPFNPETSIQFNLPVRSNVQLNVFDANGKIVKELINEERFEGSYNVTFSGDDLPSGIYYYRLNAGQFSKTMKMVLLK